MNEFKYFAFISYNSKDTKWGKKLQRKLEHYRMPSTLCSKRGWKKKPIKPIFFAPTDIQPGSLSQELQDRLKASRHLIVICSPNSARSEWVGREIAYFHSLGRSENIHFFIVEGQPHSGDKDTECFNPVVSELGIPEILGANINEKIYKLPWLNKQRAYVQLISKLLNVDFDNIWKRHRRRLIRNITLWMAGILAVAAIIIIVWFAGKSVDVNIGIDDKSPVNPDLPPLSDGVVTMYLDNETKSDTISYGEKGTFPNIPAEMIGKAARITFEGTGYFQVDTVITLSKNPTISIMRNPAYYGNIQFRIWDFANERPLSNQSLKINDMPTESNENGEVRLSVPLEKQKSFYLIESDMKLENDTIFMPCIENNTIFTE